MRTFKAGDRVKAISMEIYDFGHVAVGMVGTVLKTADVPYVGFDVPTGFTGNASGIEIPWPNDKVWPMFSHQIQWLKLISVVCPVCGSDDVTADASARWDVESQSWEVSGIYDDKTCQHCGYEGHEFSEVDV